MFVLGDPDFFAILLLPSPGDSSVFFCVPLVVSFLMSCTLRVCVCVLFCVCFCLFFYSLGWPGGQGRWAAAGAALGGAWGFVGSFAFSSPFAFSSYFFLLVCSLPVVVVLVSPILFRRCFLFVGPFLFLSVFFSRCVFFFLFFSPVGASGFCSPDVFVDFRSISFFLLFLIFFSARDFVGVLFLVPPPQVFDFVGGTKS